MAAVVLAFRKDIELIESDWNPAASRILCNLVFHLGC